MIPRTRNTVGGWVLLLCLILGIGFTGWADLAADEQPLADRVSGFALQLRLAISVASFAAYSPTFRDLRLHAQQLVNLLEGVEGRHFVRSENSSPIPLGLLVEIAAWSRRYADADLEPATRAMLAAATRNVRIYLDLALDAALSVLEQRHLDLAITDMLRVYAYLSAAYERPDESAAIPALQTILRAFGVVASETDD